MKKILVIIILLSLALSGIAQLSGNGTYASPYKGTLNQDITWSSNVYIGGDILNSAYILTINPGATVIFLVDTADIKIRGTGRFIADGTSASLIHFTADDDNDGNYGESGERWGHISFESMGSAGASLIDNCIIEFGDVSSTALTPANPRQYGGAIHTDLSNLTISNCEIRNCKAGWGGGIFVGNGKNPSISNCYVHDNISSTSGGGMYFWTGSYSTVTNCIVTYNSSTGIGGGGGLFIGGQAKNVYIINSVISHNSATNQSYGHNIRFNNNTSTPKPKFINSIVWYPANSIVYLGGGIALATDFEYCAIQTPPITYTNCITLNASNTDPAGPNFVDPDLPGLDWSINFISPCRDNGTTPSPTVPLDYAGNSRIGIYDIGTYEVQYSRWTGTTSDLWATSSNWEANVDPSSGTGDVIIPTGLSTNPVNSSNPSFTIGSGKQMILNPGAKVTLSSLTNSGTLRLGSDASNISSLIAGSFSGNAATVELYLTGGQAGSKNFRWHYISTPVSTLPVSTFTTVTPDIVRYYDSRVSTDLIQGWVAQDGWVYAAGTFGGPTFTALTPGLGYDFYDSNNNTFTFSGQLNTADVPMTLDYAGGANNGFNLLGNPFSSGLDWDYIITHRFPSNTSKGLYFTRDNALCSYIGGVGVPADVNGFIPPMQGFFTKTNAAGKTIYLADSAKTHTLHARYKGSEIIPLIRLSLADDTLSDETVVRFDIKATADIDNDFDALKIFYSADYTSIYSTAGTSKFVINGLPFPETSVDIPIGVNMKSDGIHSISTTQLEGLDQYSVSLIDNVTGFTADLRTTPVLTFTASAGSVSDRFILRVSLTTGIEDPASSEHDFNIYYGLGSINIQTLADEWDGKLGSVMVYDIAGKTVSDIRNTEFNKNSLIRVTAPTSKGLYIVELKSGMKRYAGKVVIK